eukprot:TRINITY_DN14456_c0_g1_i1.p1 TRINITY_DN14456_c0_g1~~TRINITY_DN14456_c0_g1_i1.p1  ORF type:complete len:345 (-),score=99.92 TRINITY_DN14456_c0_g1_i1:76-1110(-)
MAPAGLDLSLDEVIDSTGGRKGRGKGKGKWRDETDAGDKGTEEKAEAEKGGNDDAELSLDMSLEDLIKKDYDGAKAAKYASKGEKSWGSGNSWSSGGKSWQSGGSKGWEKSEKSSWSKSDSWGDEGKASWKKSWDDKDSWKSGGGGKKDWESGGGKWSKGDDDWWSSGKDDWKSGGASNWSKKGDDWNDWGSKRSGGGYDSWESKDKRPRNEEERKARWNDGDYSSSGGHDSWRDDRRDEHGYRGGQSRDYADRDRRGSYRERSRSPPARRGEPTEVKVSNIPADLDQRDIRDAFNSQCGAVLECNMSRGVARILFKRPEYAQKAVKTFDRGELNGNIISVKLI